MTATRAEWLLFKRLMLVVVALVVLMVAVLMVAPFLINTEALKNEIEARVEAATGRALSIEGPLEISVFPRVGFEINGVRLANPPSFPDRPFIAVDRAELRVRPLPLLTGDVVVDAVVLEGLRVNAARNAQGRTSWAGLLGAADTREAETAAGDAPTSPPADQPAPSPEAEAPPSEQNGSLLHVRVGRIEVRDARLTWDDAVTDRKIVVSDFHVTTRALQRSSATSLVMIGGTLEAGAAPPLDIGATARVGYDLAARTLTLNNLGIGLSGHGWLLPAGKSAEINADVHVDAAAGTSSLDQLVFRALNIVTAQGAANVRFGDGTPSFKGHLAVKPFSPAKLAGAMDWPLPERADPDALQQASLSLEISGTPQAISVEPLEAKIDQTTISGRARVRLEETPSLQFALAADAIDLDRYLPEPGPTASDDDAAGGGPGIEAGADPIASLPLEALHGVAAEGELTVGRLHWRGLAMEDLRVQTNLANGVLDLTEAALRVADGRIGLSGRLDASDTERPAVHLDAKIANMRSQPLLAAFLGSAPVTGRLDASASLTTDGATLDDWIAAMDGKFSTAFTNGAIRGINIAQRLRVAAARLHGDEPAQAAETRATDFSSLRISGTIENGVVRSDDLDLRTPLLRVGGKGRVNLAQRTLDYTAVLLLTDTLKGQGGATLADLSGIEIPLRFSGDLSSPDIDLQIADVIQERAREQLQQERDKAEQRAREEIEKQKGEAGERLKKELRKGLEGLFE